jgi:hypothetical protein
MVNSNACNNASSSNAVKKSKKKSGPAVASTIENFKTTFTGDRLYEFLIASCGPKYGLNCYDIPRSNGCVIATLIVMFFVVSEKYGHVHKKYRDVYTQLTDVHGIRLPSDWRDHMECDASYCVPFPFSFAHTLIILDHFIAHALFADRPPVNAVGPGVMCAMIAIHNRNTKVPSDNFADFFKLDEIHFPDYHDIVWSFFKNFELSGKLIVLRATRDGSLADHVSDFPGSDTDNLNHFPAKLRGVCEFSFMLLVECGDDFEKEHMLLCEPC